MKNATNALLAGLLACAIAACGSDNGGVKGDSGVRKDAASRDDGQVGDSRPTDSAASGDTGPGADSATDARSTDAPAGDSAAAADSAATDSAATDSAAADSAAADSVAADSAAADSVAPPTQAGVIGYAYTHLESQASDYTPLAAYSYNSSGGAITAKRLGTGKYQIVFAGLSMAGANVQVTPYGTAMDGYCISKQWTGGTVHVDCFDENGVAVDSKYVVTVWKKGVTTTARVTAYAYANNKSSASYTASATYSYNSGGGAITATRSGVGTYAIEFASLGKGGSGNVQVSSYGSDPDHCVLTNYATDKITLRCYDAAGVLSDAPYLITVIENKPSSPSTAEAVAYAWAHSDSSASYDLSSHLYAFNSTGGAITATRSGQGQYAIEFKGVAMLGATVLVTSYNNPQNDCRVWSFSGATVNIRCFTHFAAAFSDSRYTVVVIKK